MYLPGSYSDLSMISVILREKEFMVFKYNCILLLYIKNKYQYYY